MLTHLSQIPKVRLLCECMCVCTFAVVSLEEKCICGKMMAGWVVSTHAQGGTKYFKTFNSVWMLIQVDQMEYIWAIIWLFICSETFNTFFVLGRNPKVQPWFGLCRFQSSPVPSIWYWQMCYLCTWRPLLALLAPVWMNETSQIWKGGPCLLLWTFQWIEEEGFKLKRGRLESLPLASFSGTKHVNWSSLQTAKLWSSRWKQAMNGNNPQLSCPLPSLHFGQFLLVTDF